MFWEELSPSPTFISPPSLIPPAQLMTVTVIAVYYFWLDHKKSPILDVRVLNMPLEYSVFQEQKGLHLY